MKKWILKLVILVIGAIFIYTKTFFKYNEKKQISISINNHIKSFDPATVFNDDAMLLMAQSLESLFQYHYLKRPYEVIPALAEELPKILDGGLVYRIKIKKNVKYTSSSPEFKIERDLIVDDFMWQIKRLAFAPLKSTGAWLFEGRLKGFKTFREKVGDDFNLFLNSEIEGLKKIDDWTFEIHLEKPEPNLLYFLSMHFTAPVPIEMIKFFKNDLSKVLVGTGPYRFVKYEDNAYFFTKNSQFREEFYPSTGDRYANTENLLTSSKEKLPFINDITFKVKPGEDERWQSFIAQDLDILDVPKKLLFKLTDPTSETNKELQGMGVIVKHFARQTTRWLGFNMNDPLLGKNLMLRKAIAHIIDHEKYIKILTNNTNLKSNSIFNPSIIGYRPEHRLPYEYNVELAKKYLSESGLDPSQIHLTYSTRGKEDIHHQEAKFLKEQFKKINIDLKVEYLNFSDFLKLGRAGKLQFWTDNWIYDYPDAENLLQLLISKNHPGINKSGFSSSRVDQLYRELSVTLKASERNRIMYEIESIVEEEIPWVMLMYESTYIVQQKGIKNFRRSFFIRNYVKYLDVE